MTSSKPFEWIHLELIPLPDQAEHYLPCEVWWNPNSGEIIGEQADFIVGVINQQLSLGSVSNSNGTIEISEPFTKPTELASILGQYYWVIPVPVEAPYQTNKNINSDTQSSDPSKLH